MEKVNLSKMLLQHLFEDR